MAHPPQKPFTRDALEALYVKYNHPRFVHPDPLEFLHEYEESAEREIVALLASSLAYGRVRQILKSVSTALEAIDCLPQFVQTRPLSDMKAVFRDFKHRFTTGDDLAELLFGIGRVLERFGSLGTCFASGIDPADRTFHNALIQFARALTTPSGGRFSSLVPDPSRGSACKRLNLMLRWLVRKDAVDPGGWHDLDASMLIVPLDTHMHRIALDHGLTLRKSADMRTAIEITSAFAEFSPDDPARYDFALTRPGIGGHT